MHLFFHGVIKTHFMIYLTPMKINILPPFLLSCHTVMHHRSCILLNSILFPVKSKYHNNSKLAPINSCAANFHGTTLEKWMKYYYCNCIIAWASILVLANGKELTPLSRHIHIIGAASLGHPIFFNLLV